MSVIYLNPLGRRRGVNLITTMPPPLYPSSGSGIGPVITNLPRRKTTFKKPSEPIYREIVVPEKKKVKRDRCWSQVVPDIFVAFKGDSDDKVVVVDKGVKYTHVVTISLAKAAGIQETKTEFPDGSCVKALHLSIRKPKMLLMRPPRDGLGLSAAQLKATTAFLTEAFSSETRARVLITTPYRRQTDAMVVILTYLGHSLEEDAGEVSKVIDANEALRSTWKGDITLDELDIIESVLFRIKLDNDE